jgi:hypothetical protein
MDDDPWPIRIALAVLVIFAVAVACLYWRASIGP